MLRRAFEVQTAIPQTMRLPFKNKRVFLAHEWYAAVSVQSVWRGRSLRRKLSSQGSNTSLSDTVTTSAQQLFEPKQPGVHPLRRHASEQDNKTRQGRKKAGHSPTPGQSPQTPLEGSAVPFLSTPGRPHSPVPVSSPMLTPLTRTLAYDGPLTSAAPGEPQVEDKDQDKDKDKDKDKGRRSRHASSAHAASPPAVAKQPAQDEEEEQHSGLAPDAVVISVAEGPIPTTVGPSHPVVELPAAVETDALLNSRSRGAMSPRLQEEEEDGEVPDWEAIREAQLVAQELHRLVEEDLSALYATHGPGLLEGEGLLDMDEEEEEARLEAIREEARSLRRSPLSPYNFLSPRRSPATSHSRGPTPTHSPGVRSRATSQAPGQSASRSRATSQAPGQSASRPMSPRSPTRRTPRSSARLSPRYQRREEDQQETESLI